MRNWRCVLTLDQDMGVVGGQETDLQQAIRRGADLRIYTEFKYDEHVEPGSDNRELVQEVSDFRVTYLVDDRWAVGIMSLRVPVVPPEGFGPRASMSLFMYNQNGRQAIARLHMDGQPTGGKPGPSPKNDHSDMPKYDEHDVWDSQTNAPSSNFTYYFDAFRFMVRDDWREVLSCDDDGSVISGSLQPLVDAFVDGAEVKVGIRGLCQDLWSEYDHEVFVQCGPLYYNTERMIFSAETQPVVRVKADIPMHYESRGWDYGWLMLRSDGFVARWLCNPYTLKFAKSEDQYAIRWFVRT